MPESPEALSEAAATCRRSQSSVLSVEESAWHQPYVVRTNILVFDFSEALSVLDRGMSDMDGNVSIYQCVSMMRINYVAR